MHAASVECKDFYTWVCEVGVVEGWCSGIDVDVCVFYVLL